MEYNLDLVKKMQKSNRCNKVKQDLEELLKIDKSKINCPHHQYLKIEKKRNEKVLLEKKKGRNQIT